MRSCAWFVDILPVLEDGEDVNWYNEGPNPAKVGEFIRYTYEYDVATNKLKITKEIGPYRNGKFTPHTTEVEKNPAAPPAEFKDLKLNGTQISFLDGGCGCPARSFVLAAADPVQPQLLTLTNPALVSDGTVETGISTSIQPQTLVTVELPKGTRYAGPGSNPYWLVTYVQETLLALIYQGPEPLTVGVGDVIGGIGWLAPVPSPSPTSSPGGPTPTASPTGYPSPTSTVSPSATPTFNPTPIPS